MYRPNLSNVQVTVHKKERTSTRICENRVSGFSAYAVWNLLVPVVAVWPISCF